MALVENLPVVHGASGLVKLRNSLELDGVLDNTPEQTKATQYSGDHKTSNSANMKIASQSDFCYETS
jgi:hypothetical protein